MADNSVINEIFGENAYQQLAFFKKELSVVISNIEKLNNILKSKNTDNGLIPQTINQLELEQKAVAKLETTIAQTQARINAQEKEKLILLEQTILTEKKRRAEIRETVAAEGRHANSITSLALKLKQLKKDYKDLSEEDRKGVVGKQLVKTIKELGTELKSTNEPFKATTSIIGRLPTYLSNLAALITTSLLGTLSRLGEYFINVFKNIQDTGDGLMETLQGVSSGWDYFTKSLATGDFSNFFSNMKRAIDAGREYARVMDELGDLNRALKLDIADLTLQNEELKQVMDNVNLSYEERLSATEKIIENEKRIAEETKKNAKLEADVTLKDVAGKLGIKEGEQNQLLELIKTYNKGTEQLRDQAKEYNQQIERIAQLRAAARQASSQAQSRGGEFGAQAELIQREFIDKATKEVKLYADILRSYGKSTDAELDKIVETQVKVKDADIKLLEQTRRAARTRETLKKSIADQADKSAEAEKKAAEKTAAAMEASIAQQKALLRLQQDIAKAELTVIQLRSEADQKALKKTMDDEKTAYESRVMAADNFFEIMKEMQLDKEAFDKEAASRAVEQRMAEDKGITGLSETEKKIKYNQLLEAELARIAQDGANKRLEIEQNYDEKLKQIFESNAKVFVDSMNKRIAAAKKFNDINEDEALAALLDAYKRGELSREQYERKKNEIVKEYAKKNYDLEIDALEAALRSTDLTLSERERLEKILHDNKRKRARETADYEFNQMKDLAEKEKNLRSQLASELENFAKSFVSGRFEAAKQNLDAEEERLRRNADLEISLLEKTKREELAKFKEEGASSEELANKRIELDGDVADKKLIIEERLKAQEIAIEQRRRQMNIQEAKFNRMAAIAKVVANTAVAISGALLTPTLLPMIISMGAIQLGAILSTPLPRYAKGTDNHKGGLAILGDGGKSELAIAPDGATYLSGNRPELVNMPKGTIVFPDAKAVELSLLKKINIDHNHSVQKAQREIIPNNVSVAMNFDRNGIVKIVRDGLAHVEDINNSI